jgi:hypothetical protein
VGAGAAINSAMRQVGGAVGTAVLTADYRLQIAPSLPRLPEAARDQAAESAQGARAAAAATREPWLVDAANHAFLQAMYTSSIWATLLSLIGVAFVIRCFRPDR